MTVVPTLADIEAAREALEGVSIYTPMEESRWLSDIAGGPVRLKAENLQRTGSFKIRGAYLRMSRLSDEEKATGVVAASAGNHAQAVAYHAGRLGIAATIVMPEGTPLLKVANTRGHGARVALHVA
ncbi:MAG: threonine ammonia-lyase, partial [Nocardioidaceae bacterium]